MPDPTLGLYGLALLGLLLLLRLPVGTALLIVGAGGLILLDIERPAAALNRIGTSVFSTASLPALCLVPLVSLLAQLCAASRISLDAMRVCDARLPGRAGGSPAGTGLTALIGGAASGALLGSSLAATASVGRTMLRTGRRAGGAPESVGAAVAAGGACGQIVAPTITMLAYSVLSGQALEALFIAALLPGLLLLLGFAVLAGRSSVNEPSGPGDRAPDDTHPAAVSVLTLVPLATLATAIIVPVWSGWMDMIEAIAAGSIIALVTLARRVTGLARPIVQVLAQTLRASGPIFWLLIGAVVFASFMEACGLPQWLGEVVGDGSFPTWLLLTVLLLALLIAGMFLDGLSTTVLVMPLVLPLARDIGLDLLWLGVVVVIVLELALLAPPFGILVFMIKTVIPAVDTRLIIGALLPYWLTMLVALLVLLAVPSLATWLPGTMTPA